MSVSGIFGNMANNASAVSYQLQNSQLQQLGQDLTSGNLSAAQSDFATLQQAFTQPSAVPTSSTSNPVTQAFQQLSSDLQSGNLTAAQKDYSTIQQDLQSPSRHLHMHHRMQPDSSNQNPLLQDLNQLGQDLSASNLTAAQQAYASLQQGLGSATATSGTNIVGQALAGLPVDVSAVSFMA
ncbi:MAG: hypothetical protein WA172_10550 [Terriglobales bacterium]